MLSIYWNSEKVKIVCVLWPLWDGIHKRSRSVVWSSIGALTYSMNHLWRSCATLPYRCYLGIVTTQHTGSDGLPLSSWLTLMCAGNVMYNGINPVSISLHLQMWRSSHDFRWGNGKPGKVTFSVCVCVGMYVCDSDQVRWLSLFVCAWVCMFVTEIKCCHAKHWCCLILLKAEKLTCRDKSIRVLCVTIILKRQTSQHRTNEGNCIKHTHTQTHLYIH